MRGSSKASRPAFWQEVVTRQRASGLSIKAFCEREGVSYQSFFIWKRRLGLIATEGPAIVAFAPVRVQPEVAPEAAAGGIEILLPRDRRVRLTGTVDPQQLAAVLAALAG